MAVIPVLLGCTIVIGGSIATWRQGETAERARDKAISQSLALQPTPAPASHEPSVLPPRAPEVRRAERVPVTVKRATLLRLPGQELGVYKWYELPDVWGGGSVWARYMGTKGRFSEIPPDPVPGDLWNVTETGASWVYCMPAGHDHPVWIDP